MIFNILLILGEPETLAERRLKKAKIGDFMSIEGLYRLYKLEFNLLKYKYI